MDFVCPRPSQGKNRSWSTGEPVTCAGCRAGEHQGWGAPGRTALAWGVSVTVVPLPSKTGDLGFKHQWKSVQNIQNNFSVELIYFC